uniref:Peptidyl-prolyl cis-trans isomerase CYP37, chloroplastic isoform X2 n=1 Tax=Elaeis guineensis var. tenera TaxID=51953 RepID=A0A6J0PGS6_ELAGV|nr:peptidyl-prolyl cis-trans isomerase CYP37, chloroplastic isoform X2 [Elaeis guineensis]
MVHGGLKWIKKRSGSLVTAIFFPFSMAAAPVAFACYHVSLSSDASALSLLGKKRAAPHIPSLLLWRPTDRKRAACVRISATASSKYPLSKNRSPPRESSDSCLIPMSSVFSWLYHGLKGHKCAIVAMLIFAQISFPLSMSNWSPWFASTANAVLYSPDTKVPRTGELALRRAIPANAIMKAIQESLEDISYLLRIPQRKPYGTMEGDVKKAIKIATEEKESILGSIPKEFKEKGSVLYASLLDGKGGLQNLIEFIKEQDPDKVSVGLSSSLDTVAELELLQAPGLSFLLPEQYLKYPRLTGRGTVEFTIERGDGSTFFPTAGGEPKSLATVQVVLDGYSSPLTAGNFAKLVLDGAYDGVRLKCANQAILSDNELERYGYSVPIEVMPSGQFEPLYKTTLSVQDGELPVLPLSVYGAVAMAHSVDSDDYSSPSQFFFYLYDKRSVYNCWKRSTFPD